MNDLLKDLKKQSEAAASVLPDGTFPLNEEYHAILELDKKLTEAGIPHTLERMMDGWIICYPEDGRKRKGDVIQHFGSYGAFRDLMEAYGFGLKNPVGWLDAEKAFEYFRKAHEEGQHGKRKKDV